MLLQRSLSFYLSLSFLPSGMAASITAPVPLTTNFPAVRTVVAAKSTAAPTTQPLSVKQRTSAGSRRFVHLNGCIRSVLRDDGRIRVLLAKHRRRRQILQLRQIRRFLPCLPALPNFLRLLPKSREYRVVCRGQAGRLVGRAKQSNSRFAFVRIRHRDGWFHFRY